MKIGVNTVYYAGCPLREAVARIRADGFEAVHLFLDFADGHYYPFPYDSDRVDLAALVPAVCERIRRSFEEGGIEIAALGGYTNLIEPGEERRKRNVDNLRRLVSMARSLGADIVATESGELPTLADTLSEQSQDRLLSSLAELVPDLERHGVTLALEAYEQTTLNTSRRLLEAIDAVGSDRVRVLLDPGNTFVTDSLEETFDLVGGYVVAAHAKDVMVTGGRLGPARMGEGHLDHGHYVDHLKRIGFSGPWILDLTDGEDLRKAKGFLEDIVTSRERRGGI